ncbi:MAG TPA: hypothetical protein VJP89_23035 [Pyrinomonadaceae bacterium]|nr:hypothetical protein [Pyrinomonadaceae bacterium]
MKLTITLLVPILLVLAAFNCSTGGGEINYSSAPPSSRVQDCASVARYAPTKDANEPVHSWLGLIPLKTTRLDVEHVLGKAKWSHGSTFVYETACERVDVVYSKGACEVSEVYRYDVPANVVIRFEIAPKQKITLDDLKLTQSYVRQQESHPANSVQYRSREDGIRIDALIDNNVETVTVLTYEPRAKDKDRECSPVK